MSDFAHFLSRFLCLHYRMTRSKMKHFSGAKVFEAAEVTVIAFHYEYDRNVPSQALVRSPEIKSNPQILA